MLFALLLFGLGLVTDIIWCCCVRATVARHPMVASLASMALALVAVAANYRIIADHDFAGFLAYVAGCGLGTYLVTRRRA
jgi:undecaprenyl pyrophosphate phosphatase UppP